MSKVKIKIEGEEKEFDISQDAEYLKIVLLKEISIALEKMRQK